MTSFACNYVIILLATTIFTSVLASRQFHVGGHFGWRQPDQNNTAFYTQWAETNRFQIGDSLVFEYENDSVLSVEKWDYFNCDTSEPITTFTNGKSTLNLDRSGAFYFISGTDDHCNQGQKLVVEVMAPHPIPATPPTTIAVPPEGSSPIMAPSDSPFSSQSDSLEASSSTMVLASSFMPPLVIAFVVVMMLAL